MNRMDLTAKQLLDTCRKFCSRRTKKSNDCDVDEAQTSHVHVVAHGSAQHVLNQGRPTSGNTVNQGRPTSGNTMRDGLLLSGIVSVNILILGCALVSGSAFNHVAISTIHRQIFLIILVSLSTLWMLYYTVYTSRKYHAVLYKDSHACPVWLKGGLVMFGICSLIMDVFKIANYVGYLHCDSAVKIVFPAVHAVFMVFQTYFFCIHAKDCVQLQRNITRCGLMLSLSTNLVLWMAAVTEESIHQTILPEDTNITKLLPRSPFVKASYGHNKCKCSHSACDVLEKAYYYLYPFNIEYSLFASAMAYVMWKNVGRMMDEHNQLHKHHFSVKDVFLGPVAGIVLVLAGLVTFVLYELDVVKEDHGKRDTALMMHYVMNLVAVTLMSVCTVVGCAIYRADQREHVSAKNPTRSLDVGLLMGASLGTFVIDYFSIVAVVATGAKDYLSALSLASCLLTVVQLGLQNYFIIEGLHREPFHEKHPATQHTDVEVCDMNSHALALAAVHAEMGKRFHEKQPATQHTDVELCDMNSHAHAAVHTEMDNRLHSEPFHEKHPATQHTDVEVCDMNSHALALAAVHAEMGKRFHEKHPATQHTDVEVCDMNSHALALAAVHAEMGKRFHEKHPATQHTDVEHCDMNSHALAAVHTIKTRDVVHDAPPQHRLTWKRRLLKETCAFLLLANIILWIIPAFGARPQFDNPIGTEFYKSTMWVAVVNIGLPFGIFYRMHSVASLFEVFSTS